MSEIKHETGIQWTHVPGYRGATWNPTTGCTRVSPGCDHCYAFQLHDQRYKVNRDAAREFRFTIPEGGGVPNPVQARAAGVSLPMPPQYDRPFSQVQVLSEDRLTEPLRKRTPHAYFVDSMSDLFHEDVPDEFIGRVFDVMARSPQHLFMILTKRPRRMRSAALTLDVWGARHGIQWPLPNVWLGVSVEDQERADERIPLLLDTPAAVRFLSCEPLLGPVEFSDVTRRSDAVQQLGRPALAGIDWVIVGGESGTGARPFDLAWARSIVQQCQAAGVATFVKQLGSRPLDSRYSNDPPDGWGLRLRLKHNHGGNPDEWPEDLRVREWPAVVAAAVPA